MHDQLSLQDATFIYAESDAAPINVGFLAFFEDRGITEESLCHHVASRLHRFPRLRQKLAFVPLEQGHPVWVDDEQFDVRLHVRSVALLGDRGEAEARKLLARIMSVPLPRSRPLWEIWLFPMSDNRVGMVAKLHHCLLDGVSGVKLVRMLFDCTPDLPRHEVEQWTPSSAPKRIDLFRNALQSRWHKLKALASPRTDKGATIPFGLHHVRSVVELSRAAIHAPRRVAMVQPVGPERRFETFCIPLDEVKAAKGVLGCKLNDVVLALVAGAVHHQLERRGITTMGATVKAAVPVSRHDPGAANDLGNQVSLLTVDLPVGGMDPLRRLEQIAADMLQRKQSGQAEGVDFWLGLAEHVSPALVSTVTKAVSRQRLIDLGVTNVPGPPIPLYLLGGRMLDIFPYTPLFGATSLGVAVSSYDGTLYFGISGDWDGQADLDVFTEGIGLAWHALSRRLEERQTAPDVAIEPRTMYPPLQPARRINGGSSLTL